MLADVAPGAGAARAAWRSRCRPRRRGRRREAPRVGRADVRHVAAAQHLHAEGAATLLEIAIAGRLGGRARATSRCCTSSSTSRRRAAFDALIDTEGGAQQDRFVGGSQLDLAAHGREAAATASCSRRRCAGSRRTSTASRVHADGTRSARARAVVAMPPTLTRADRLRPAAAGAARPADPAHAAGDGDQVHGGLRDAVLARGGAQRPGAQRRGPGASDVRQLAARRQPRRAARLPRGPHRA